MTTRVPLLLLLLAAPVPAQDSMVISGLTLTLGTTRADVEKSLQPRFRAELMQKGEWAIWERATEQGGLAPPTQPAAARQTIWEQYNVAPPRVLPPPQGPKVFWTPQDVPVYAVKLKAVNDANQAEFQRAQAELTAAQTAEQQHPKAEPRQAAPAMRRLPVGYLTFTDDGKLCHIAKEWNPNPGTPADSVRALSAALAAQKGQSLPGLSGLREAGIKSDKSALGFFFPEAPGSVHVWAEEDGSVSIIENTRPCAAEPPKPKE